MNHISIVTIQVMKNSISLCFENLFHSDSPDNAVTKVSWTPIIKCIPGRWYRFMKVLFMNHKNFVQKSTNCYCGNCARRSFPVSGQREISAAFKIQTCSCQWSLKFPHWIQYRRQQFNFMRISLSRSNKGQTFIREVASGWSLRV